MIKNTELMPFKKFVQMKGLIYTERIVKINGTFKDKNTGKIIKGDIFNANLIGGNKHYRVMIEETYKTYLDWWNHIKYNHESEREFVSAEVIL